MVALVFLALAAVLVYTAVGRAKQRAAALPSTDKFDSIADAVGFQARPVIPEPEASLADMADRDVPMLSSFARFAETVSFPGMVGECDGVKIAVWEARRGYPRTHFVAAVDIQGAPPFIVRQGKFLGALPVESNESPRVDVGDGEFAKSFTVRGDDEAALNAYFTDARQQAVADLAAEWVEVEISNTRIEAGTSERVSSGEAGEVGQRLATIAALAKTLSSP